MVSNGADAVRRGVAGLRHSTAVDRSVIRLREQSGGGQPWNLVITLNVQPRADGLGASAWIDRPAEA